MPFPVDFSQADLGWVAAGFLLVVTLVAWANLRKKPKFKVTHWVAEVPAKMIIEEESSS